jgi:hypothetical protein
VCEAAASDGFSADEFERARKKLHFAYALLQDSLFDRAVSLAEDTLLGFPLPEEIEALTRDFTLDEVGAAWQRVWRGRKLVALLS